MKLSPIISLHIVLFTYRVSVTLTNFTCVHSSTGCDLASFEISECSSAKFGSTLTGCDDTGANCRGCSILDDGSSNFQAAKESLNKWCIDDNGNLELTGSALPSCQCISAQ